MNFEGSFGVEKMANAKLDIWLRDEKCRPYPILAPGFPTFDWVRVYNCMGEAVTDKLPIPKDSAHVVTEVPPGCYIVEGKVCENDRRGYRNGPTDRAIVIVGCGQMECVNLFVPPVIHCVRRDINAILGAARRLVPEEHLAITARTMLAAGNLREDEILHEMTQGAEAIANVPELADIRESLNKNIDTIRKIPKIDKK
ncbi:MAG: hypothetical protein QHG98_04270 [Methanothrix sp.]|uniref:hypothetical protein n=1 Tax=Methanothrix sp. TaxID=90426 RepID=UPI00247D5311|nr:hypothetical protein [Methanothrix sp.]